MSTTTQLITENNGQYLKVTGPDSGQCTAVAHRLQQLNGTPIVYGNAVDTFANAGPEYDKIAYTFGLFPQEGDTVVWRRNATIGTSSAGHTAVCDGQADAYTFWSFDQNWPVGQPCKLIHHAYDGVVGWYRPKGVTMDTDKFLQDGDTVNYYRAFEGRDPSSDELSYWRGKTFKKIYYDNALGQATSLRQQAQNPQVINHDSVLKYVQDNLK